MTGNDAISFKSVTVYQNLINCQNIKISLWELRTLRAVMFSVKHEMKRYSLNVSLRNFIIRSRSVFYHNWKHILKEKKYQLLYTGPYHELAMTNLTVSAYGLTCYNCLNVSDPSTCTSTVACQNDEVSIWCYLWIYCDLKEYELNSTK